MNGRLRSANYSSCDIPVFGTETRRMLRAGTSSGSTSSRKSSVLPLRSQQVWKNPLLYKTTLCDFWVAGAECKFGRVCWYAHGEAELRYVPRLNGGGQHERSMQLATSFGSMNLSMERSFNESFVQDDDHRFPGVSNPSFTTQGNNGTKFLPRNNETIFVPRTNGTTFLPATKLPANRKSNVALPRAYAIPQQTKRFVPSRLMAPRVPTIEEETCKPTFREYLSSLEANHYAAVRSSHVFPESSRTGLHDASFSSYNANDSFAQQQPPPGFVPGLQLKSGRRRDSLNATYSASSSESDAHSPSYLNLSML